MNVNQYVNSIAKKVKCGGAKKKDIKQQLEMDINMRLEQGEKLEDIMAQMGSAKEIADSFNENISDKERKLYSRNRVLKNVFSCIVVILILICLVYWMMPKAVDIEQSKYFDKAEVENAMKHTVELLDAGDYDSLKENAIEQLQAVLDEENIGKARAQISDDWGGRTQFGTIYMVELVQKNTHYVVGEIMVSYENVNITYRLTYDEEMRLAGVYMR